MTMKKFDSDKEKLQEKIKSLKDELHLKDIEIKFIESKFRQNNQQKQQYQEE